VSAFLRRSDGLPRLLEVLPADGGDGSVRVHEAVFFLDTTHATNETEWEVGSDSWVVVQEGNSLSGEGGDVAPVVSTSEVLVQILQLNARKSWLKWYSQCRQTR
jgi:hypothetical protein